MEMQLAAEAKDRHSMFLNAPPEKWLMSGKVANFSLQRMRHSEDTTSLTWLTREVPGHSASSRSSEMFCTFLAKQTVRWLEEGGT